MSIIRFTWGKQTDFEWHGYSCRHARQSHCVNTIWHHRKKTERRERLRPQLSRPGLRLPSLDTQDAFPELSYWQSPSRDPWSKCLINSRETTKGKLILIPASKKTMQRQFEDAWDTTNLSGTCPKKGQVSWPIDIPVIIDAFLLLDIQIRVSCSAYINAFQWNREWLFSWREKFNYGFKVMAVYDVYWNGPRNISCFTSIWKWVLR